MVLDGDRITLRNDVLVAEWSIGDAGLRPLCFRHEETGESLSLTGELFVVSLRDGTRYAASALLPESGPALAELAGEARAPRLAERLARRQVQLPLRSVDGRLRVLWSAVLAEDANYVRQELELAAVAEELDLTETAWIREPVAGARVAGRVDGSPLVAGSLFFGIEDPQALNAVAAPQLPAGETVQSSGGVTLIAPVAPAICRLERDSPLRAGAPVAQSFVWGVAPPGQLRRAFLHYIERERAHPYRPFLHYNSWYDIAAGLFTLNEENCCDAIRAIGESLVKAHQVQVDAMVFDDGWDDPQTLWGFHHGFPRGFTPLAQLSAQYGTRFGVWLSPFGGYGQGREARLEEGAAQGFEINAAGFSMAGPRYYAAFKQACVSMIRQFGVNHFKFDGIASGVSASGPGSDFRPDTEAMRRLMLELRQEDPALYINLTTGSWPSPFWLRYADSVWRQGGDMGFTGKGNKQQQWLTYRDRETYRNIVQRGPLFPLNALMTQGVAYSRRGMAGDPTFDSAGFRDDVHAFFGSGTSLQELYIQPGRLTDEDWRVLAVAAKWARANADVLVDTHWIGGDPGRLEVYGYASWSPRMGIVMLRNPDDQPHAFALEPGAAFELPPGAARRFTLRSAWAEDGPEPARVAEAGTPVEFALEPFEVLVLDAHPVQ